MPAVRVIAWGCRPLDADEPRLSPFTPGDDALLGLQTSIFSIEAVTGARSKSPRRASRPLSHMLPVFRTTRESTYTGSDAAMAPFHRLDMDARADGSFDYFLRCDGRVIGRHAMTGASLGRSRRAMRDIRASLI